MDWKIIVLIIGAYGAIIAHMGWVSIQLGRIYNLVNQHLQNGKIHRASSDFVTDAVCQERVKRFEEKIDNVNRGVNEIKETLSKK